MRPDRRFLVDIVESADAVVDHIAGRDREALLEDRTARAAVLHELAVIGEVASRITAEVAGAPSGGSVVGDRGVSQRRDPPLLRLSWSIIWVTATEDVPALRAQVTAILEADFPEATHA